MLLRGVDDNGDPIEVYAQTCPACGALVNTAEADMDDHYESVHRS